MKSVRRSQAYTRASQDSPLRCTNKDRCLRSRRCLDRFCEERCGTTRVRCWAADHSRSVVQAMRCLPTVASPSTLQASVQPCSASAPAAAITTKQQRDTNPKKRIHDSDDTRNGQQRDVALNDSPAKRKRARNQGVVRTGRWSADEQRLFLEGLMRFGKDWKAMVPLIKTRTLVQIRTHAQKMFKRMNFLQDSDNVDAVSAVTHAKPDQPVADNATTSHDSKASASVAAVTYNQSNITSQSKQTE